jgi:hypothetical protein
MNSDYHSSRFKKDIFLEFSQFHEELAINILSFLADIPYETSSQEKESTLVHTFPLVCKKFNSICRTNDFLWAICIERLIKNNPDLWGNALQHFLKTHLFDNGQTQTSFMNGTVSLDQACQVMRGVISTNNIRTRYGIHGELYRYLLSNFIRYVAPVFYMPDESIQRGQPFGLHFFEPRYRRLIAEVMEPYPEEFRNGRTTVAENGITNPPTFIYGNRAPLKQGQVALIVQVLQCFIRENGTADVFLLPLHNVRVDRVWEQADMNDHLYFARVHMMRTSEEEQAQFESDEARRSFRGNEGGVRTYVHEVLHALNRRQGGEDEDNEAE